MAGVNVHACHAHKSCIIVDVVTIIRGVSYLVGVGDRLKKDFVPNVLCTQCIKSFDLEEYGLTHSTTTSKMGLVISIFDTTDLPYHYQKDL